MASAQEITKLYSHLEEALLSFERKTVEDWAAKAEETGEERLKQCLLIRDDSAELPFLAVNFDPMITRLLREVKYFLLLNVAVPAGAEKIFKRGETLRQQTGNLELITGIYNEILSTLLPVERPLIEKKLEAVDAALAKGLTVLNWNSHHIDDYIVEARPLLPACHANTSAHPCGGSGSSSAASRLLCRAPGSFAPSAQACFRLT